MIDFSLYPIAFNMSTMGSSADELFYTDTTYEIYSAIRYKLYSIIVDKFLDVKYLEKHKVPYYEKGCLKYKNSYIDATRETYRDNLLDSEDFCNFTNFFSENIEKKLVERIIFEPDDLCRGIDGLASVDNCYSSGYLYEEFLSYGDMYDYLLKNDFEGFIKALEEESEEKIRCKETFHDVWVDLIEEIKMCREFSEPYFVFDDWYDEFMQLSYTMFQRNECMFCPVYYEIYKFILASEWVEYKNSGVVEHGELEKRADYLLKFLNDNFCLAYMHNCIDDRYDGGAYPYEFSSPFIQVYLFELNTVLISLNEKYGFFTKSLEQEVL